jgi:hypothetical protein
LNSASEQQRLALGNGNPIYDLFAAGDHLFVLAGARLYAFRLAAGFLESAGDIALSALSEDGLTGRKRLFVGGGIAYASNGNGYDTVDVTNPTAMRPIGRTPPGGPASFKQIVLNGSGLGIAGVGAQPRGAQGISLYRTTNPTNTADFVTTFPMPGEARAVSIYNGIAYVADGANGLQVLNYLAFDNLRQPPTIQLFTNSSEGRAEEGQFLRLTAEVGDDVQVRNVEFYLDGQKLVTDGSFPFEQRMLMPLRSSGRESVSVRARASDTGGNVSWSEELVLILMPDATPPAVIRVLPSASSLAGAITNIFAFFSEPINAATLAPASFRLSHAGADGLFGTPDDAVVSGGTIRYQETLNAVLLQFPASLAPGNYRAAVSAPIADRAGNPLTQPFSWGFRVFDRVDNDVDGVPDELEVALGLDPTKTDTDGNGIPDGREDPDRDNLPTAWEIFFSYDARNADTDRNGIADDREDPDRDLLVNLDEFRNGTDPRDPDSDNDGWNDETEVAGASGALDPASTPRPFIVARPPLAAALVSLSGAIRPGTVVARPPVQVYALSMTAAGAIAPGTVIARPPVAVVRTGFGIANQETIIGKPPVQVRIGP